MKLKLPALGTAALIAAMAATPAYAQDSHGHLPLTDADLYPSSAPQELTMQQYLSQRPEIAEAIRKDPSILNHPAFLKQQPRIGLFLKDHPDIAEKVKTNPAVFLAYAFDTQPNLERGQNPELEDYLEKHPHVAQALRKNPRLVDDPNFLDNHLVIKVYFSDHPDAREVLKANPNCYIHKDLDGVLN